MTQRTERTANRRSYAKPRLERVELVPEEAVLQACKAGKYNLPGVCGLSLCVWVFTICSDVGS